MQDEPAERPDPGEIAFCLLQEVRAEFGGRTIPLGDQKRRLILAILLSHRMPVSDDALIGMAWEGAELDRIAAPVRLLQDHVQKLRGALKRAKPGAERLLPRGAGGYRSEAGRRQVDLWRFTDLAERARTLEGRDDARAVRLYRGALAQWGPLPDGPWTAAPLSGLKSCPWVDRTRQELVAEYQRALLACLEIELRIGPPGALVPELHRLTEAAEPPHDGFARLLLLALHRTGQKGAAVDAYERHCDRTEKHVGAAPGADLRELLQRICNDDPALSPPPPPPTGASMSESPSSPGPARTVQEIGETAATVVVEHARHALSGTLVVPPPPAGKLVAKVHEALGADPAGAKILGDLKREPDRADAVRMLRDALVTRMLADAALLKRLSRCVEQLDAGSGTPQTTINAKRIGKVVTFNDKVRMRDFNC
ncbi:AfsR/SARP family transcriptional regulator [Actinomadura macrotermitis]|uniref:Bacterial transcriptional activator domain-containing protein n=1 Tax=Actinomadura macrotermitis TaxID=2585200 RepID=A0A7K0BYC9_9ACTN|nr:bacterial transcriptional activator domain-containing protein [Actinomadura macrotermitis]MQY05862.1 hypothetical protein [Actinomadura macrotermitis]